MFSSNVAAHPSVAALRNPRRRQRSNADESVKPPKAKRQRSTLRQDDREPAVVKHFGEAQSLQVDENGPEQISSRPVTVSELALRAPRKQEKRGDLTDGTITLSSNDFYTVSHLPSLPEQIKENPTARRMDTALPFRNMKLSFGRTQSPPSPSLQAPSFSLLSRARRGIPMTLFP
ncbi:predicted protein [Histoplasma mississippiense (nom. inval.)]|uniref:predicted protein n=1 Tax=Ajellomyces capsulatus (strain NAm1 / WU24) TaxID=2059318 RepID=UPI000157BB0F|nr:predicted protein [Histoplasma mississippiense (nom. inval.)]EDN04158.1 predicted protein [Histoplasma mississippiense (nom. inval.)]